MDIEEVGFLVSNPRGSRGRSMVAEVSGWTYGLGIAEVEDLDGRYRGT